MRRLCLGVLLWGAGTVMAVGQAAAGVSAAENPFSTLMAKAAANAQAHHAAAPVLSPAYETVLSGAVPVRELQARGTRVVPWTVNDPAKMRALIDMGVDGLISDRPDLLQRALAEARQAATPAVRQRLAGFDVSAHRGGRGLRPENTLPSFESGLDQLVTSLETDTGVTTDRQSLLWHDQFLNPESCRRADGKPYTLADRVYIRDISMAEAQRTFVCDKLHFGADQKNDLALSPVAVAFAKQEGMPSPYAPTSAAQLFRFVRFYVAYYRSGAGKAMAGAAERAANAEKVRFNLETKLIPDDLSPALLQQMAPHAPPELLQNHTVAPEVFVETLVHSIEREHATAQSEIQSFDFRTLLLVQARHPEIPTYFLTSDPKLLQTEWVPAELRAR